MFDNAIESIAEDMLQKQFKMRMVHYAGNFVQKQNQLKQQKKLADEAMNQISDEYCEKALREQVTEVSREIHLNEQALDRKARLKYDAMVENIISEQA